MSFFGNEPQGWQVPVRQASWEQPPPPSRSGASSTSQREENVAFATQFEEVERAVDNLVKSGKFYTGPRREPMPVAYGGYGGQRMPSGRHPNFYAAQRYPARPTEADQIMQAKRRMAAQRERELRNYHQEQQYNRSLLAEMASNKSDRSMSPSTLSEEGRRELIARQHRALYGPDGPGYGPPNHYNAEANTTEQTTQGQNNPQSGMRGPSPRGVDRFGMPTQTDNTQQNNEGKTTSPSSHQQGKAPSPPAAEDSSHSRTISKSTTAPVTGSMGPIGSRPTQQHAPGQSLNKRTTSPLPGSLAYGFGSGDQSNERNTPATSTTVPKDSTTPAMGAWGTGSGVWGNKIGASVWS